MSAERQSSSLTLTRTGRQAGADGGGSARRPKAVAVLGGSEGPKTMAQAKEEVRVGAFSNALRRRWRSTVAGTEQAASCFDRPPPPPPPPGQRRPLRSRGGAG